jgi:hypothetical protein
VEERIAMLIKAIDNYLENRRRDERPINCFHPSSLHKSARELYHHYLHGDIGEEFAPKILRVFDNGHAVHRRLLGYLEEIGVLKESEASVQNEEYEIVGNADGIIMIEGQRGVLEIKSMNSRGFYGAYEPKPEHLVQINIYMFCLGIPRGCLLYECKDNQELKEFYVKSDPVILDPVLEKIRYVQGCIKEGREPEG